MAPKGRKRQSSTYDSDNGFVANDSGGDNGVDHRAKKKARTSKSTAATTTAAKPSSSSFKTASSAAKPAGEGKVDANGDRYWELSRLRRVTVSSFKGRTMVNVREYYEKDGQELPGKKGISMPIDQFSNMVKILPSIEAALKGKGESLPRPEYDAGGEEKGGEEDEEEDEDGDEEEEGDEIENDEGQREDESESEEEVKPRAKKDKLAKKKNGARKKNIEATSDEDGDE